MDVGGGPVLPGARDPGAGGSAHLRGRGVDFQLLGDTTWTWEYKRKIIEWARDNAGANEGYRYTDRNHVHLGFRVSGK